MKQEGGRISTWMTRATVGGLATLIVTVFAASGLGLTTEGSPIPDEKTAKPAKKGNSYAIIAGTVFRDPGFAFPGVAVRLEPAPEGKTSVKVKKMETVSDGRGEFVFRVPPAPMRYQLVFQAPGHVVEKRTVMIAGEERQDIYVTLQPAKEGSR
ncbi:MAG: carboxypeptidase-like regulatory domain-containing protein [Bryobacteraceae bacterium]|nr:carboxypeptidase-like regulatory domain-containing protein [Bryobacteraceae bacterium]MDW8376894.1 carboxypeptidase-like regulatory domain-containing protein [Bryobacterales bacterium]